jgi:ABC-2 type transport system ATP-binding protein
MTRDLPPLPDGAAAALEVTNLSFGYERDGFRLDRVGFRIAPGAFTVLLGPNGSGKTTLLMLLTRLLDSREGTIHVSGFDLRATPTRALRRMGVVFQQPTLDLDLTVRQNLGYFASLQGLSGRRAEQRIADELDRLELSDRRRDKVRTLSGGLRRRLELARAMLHEPALLVLDEPTVGLDVPTRSRLVSHVHALARENGIAVLWTTHLIDEIDPLDQLIVLHRGRIVASGSAADIASDEAEGGIAEAFAHLTAPAQAPKTVAETLRG